MKKWNSMWLVFALALMAILGACSAKEDKESAAQGEKVEPSQAATAEVTIDNNGTTQVYKEAPKKAISLNQHVTEIMLALGLEDSMVGTAYLDDKIYEPFQAAYDKVPVLADQYPTKEQVIDAEADFLYGGWKSAFSEKGVGTPEELEALGIHTYLHTASNMTKPTLENIFIDIRNIAKIFRVEDRGEALIDQMTKDVDNIRAKLPQDGKELPVLVFDSGDKEVFTAAQNFMNELVTIAGGKNIFSDVESGWTTVSKEDAVARNPEVIVVIDYGETSAEEKINFLKNDPALKETEAVKNERFVILPLSAASEGVRAADAIQILAKGFYPDNF
ncbi:ABC transporter substrate-binding protein [Lysinibacillus pakistanensis]|uniref:ABC transporter substrate-binding protein n=1 Tax=Lysinibacillus pakistanensis TaxID=759811 RepID=A0AAX3X1R6_9BACI|nr:ABC transporter substrate-binding protein [Lysinibacillus pakistanensis]MDM5233517.1 ABC transporter substrate-binding protein [Lysinibacillus pakistanensis]WHY48989.1 ABC transporter substrate-binding protein [Lysinibacillus pakistanensis]WHY54000.1 ABC transporter substrate-binding protein [Lysinibacillus pakistanensis]